MENVDGNAIVLAIINNLATLIVAGMLAFVLFRIRGRLTDLLDRITKVGAFGVEAEFSEAREQLKDAILSYSPELYIEPKQLQAIIDRAIRLQAVLRGARILWVDDTPLANANIHRFLNEFGVVIDNTRETNEAVLALQYSSSAYEVVITDMVRGDNHQAGIELLQNIQAAGIEKAVIVFVGILDTDKPTPDGAIAITDKVDDLLTHIFNVIETERT